MYSLQLLAKLAYTSQACISQTDGMLVGDRDDDGDDEAGLDAPCRWPAPADDVQLLGARGQTRRWTFHRVGPDLGRGEQEPCKVPSEGGQERAKVFATRCVKLAYLSLLS